MIEAIQSAATDWEQTFDAVSDPMAILTPDYRVVRANAAYLAWMHTARGRCEGHECFAHGRERESPCEQCPLPRTIATRQPCYVRQVCMQPQGANGERVAHIYETWTYPVFDAEGGVDRVVEIIKDVTERERLQQVTSEAQALREADRLKAELLGTVSHELRSPLASIKGYAATLLKHGQRLSGEERREFLQAIVESSDRLAVVIDRMLEMSQLETGSVRLDHALVDMDRLAQEAVRAAEGGLQDRVPGPPAFAFAVQSLDADGRIASAPVRAAEDDDALARFTVVGDAGRLRGVFDQLIANAVKYSPGGGSVTVTLRPYQSGRETDGGAAEAAQTYQTRGAGDCADDHAGAGGLVGTNGRGTGPMVEVLVQDAGIGIPPEHLERVFDRFHRVDTRLARETDGLGLGLAIARRVVELHGGIIWAENVAGGGSRFHVVLPLAPAGPRDGGA